MIVGEELIVRHLRLFPLLSQDFSACFDLPIAIRYPVLPLFLLLSIPESSDFNLRRGVIITREISPLLNYHCS